MNERIKELANRALDRVANKRTLSDGQVERTWDPHLYDSVFAELIVRECNLALNPMLRDMISRGQACRLINEHFGIE